MDPDDLPVCSGCLHDLGDHVLTGCTAVDDLGNRCACEEAR